MNVKNQLRREAVIRAYQQGLGQDERAEVDFWASELKIGMVRRSPHIRFSHHMAVELLGSIGLLLVRSEEARCVVEHGPNLMGT